MKKIEICQKILFGRPVSEIPPNPPFDKGGQGGFLAGPWFWGNIGCWVRLCQSTNYSPKANDHVLFEQSPKFNRKGVPRTAFDVFGKRLGGD
jgi:hypothetical protein